MPCLSWYSKDCVLTLIVLVLDSFLQAQRALINAQLVQLNNEVAAVASEVEDAANELCSCTDPAKETKLHKMYDDLVVKERQLLEERRDLERQLTGALRPCVNGAVLTTITWQ